MKKILALLIPLFFTLHLLAPSTLLAKELDIIFFYGRECPHCQAEEKFLDKLAKSHPEISIKKYEVWHNKANRSTFEQYSQQYGNERLAVPLTIVRGQALIGFGTEQTTGQEILERLGIKSLEEKERKENTINIPIVGQTDIKNLSIPTLTILLGLIDGFNPCAMWALVALLAFLITLGSRRKVLIIGGSFLLASFLFSFIYMSAWMNAFQLIAYIVYVRYLVALASLVVAFIYLRDFIKNKQECKVVDANQRRLILDKMKEIGSVKLLISAILGAVVLAFTVNIIEFVCSVGLPVIYTNVLAEQKIAWWLKYLYIAIYCLFYMLDDFLVFATAVVTNRLISFSGKYNYYSRLFGAIILFLLAIWLVLSK